MQDRPQRRGVRWATLLIFALVAACDAPEPSFGHDGDAAPIDVADWMWTNIFNL